MDLYCNNITKYIRRKSSEVIIGNSKLGGNNPIRIQTMTNTPVKNLEDTVSQIERTVLAGTDYIRIAIPSKKDVLPLEQITRELKYRGINIPVIADIHFNPGLALLVAPLVDKVRINPGNYIDKKKFEYINYSDEEYLKELVLLRQEFEKLISLCKEHKTALRIGTNHGSLSDRIMSRYGDTPVGMAESSMEFLRICKSNRFENVVVSMKASNTRIMVYATRLLVKKMHEEEMHYPLHLGVTEAGEGEDGRIKSAVGIGALLADGIGDTIRVSLTEDPEKELPVAKKLISHVSRFENHKSIMPIDRYPIDPYSYTKRKTNAVLKIGGQHTPVVVSEMTEDDHAELKPDFLLIKDKNGRSDIIVPYSAWKNNDQCNISYPILNPDELGTKNPDNLPFFLKIIASDLNDNLIDHIKAFKNMILVLETKNENGFADQRAAVLRMINQKAENPVIFKRNHYTETLEDLQLEAASDLGGLFLDGLGDGIWLSNNTDAGPIPDKDVLSVAFGILQASRVRTSKTEYISCPSCGRTLFNLQDSTRKIREKTSHLKGLKIGIMGCIVNGPGEMADADYGYVGAGPGRITLYKGQEVIKRNIPEDDAVKALINVIKENGDWKEK